MKAAGISAAAVLALTAGAFGLGSTLVGAQAPPPTPTPQRQSPPPAMPAGQAPQQSPGQEAPAPGRQRGQHDGADCPHMGGSSDGNQPGASPSTTSSTSPGTSFSGRGHNHPVNLHQ